MWDSFLNTVQNAATPNGHASFFDPVWKLLDGTLAAAQNRLELFQTEVQEEKIRILELFLLAATILVLGTLALAVATFAILLVVWENGSLLVLPCAIGGYGIGAYIAWRALKARLKNNVPFEASMQELKEDRKCINPAL